MAHLYVIAVLLRIDIVFTARCYAERGYEIVYRLSVCLSVCDVEACSSRRLEYFENNLWLTQHGRSGATGTPQN